MSCSEPVDSPTSIIFSATSGTTARAVSDAASPCPSRTRCVTASSSLAMCRLPTDRAVTSSEFTSGMPPPSSVASVRAICAVVNLRTVSPMKGIVSTA